jgi:hypothetical protein
VYKSLKRTSFPGFGSPWGGGLGLPVIRNLSLNVPTPNPFSSCVSTPPGISNLLLATYLRRVVLPIPTRHVSSVLGQLPLPNPERELQLAAKVHIFVGAQDLLYRINYNFLVVGGFISLPHRRYSKAGKQECNEQILKLSVQLNQWSRGSSFLLTTPSLEKSRPRVKPIRRKREAPILVPETRLAFHPRAQQNAFRRQGFGLKRQLIISFQCTFVFTRITLELPLVPPVL